MKRYVFMLSDGTGITAESLGNSLLTQFETIEFEKQTIPFIDSLDKARLVVEKVNQCYKDTGSKPLVFMTFVRPEISAYIKQSSACILDLFNTFLAPLEQEFQIKSSYTVGKTHGAANSKSYNQRITAVNFALAHDDGIKTTNYQQADIVLIGVSRCGKTPSCLYMALQFGILAANYPFTEEAVDDFSLPQQLVPYKHKLFGLTIDPFRLHQIRSERRPDSEYASLEQCKHEIQVVENMYKRELIPFLNSTRYSIEEISTKIMASAGLKRKC